MPWLPAEHCLVRSLLSQILGLWKIIYLLWAFLCFSSKVLTFLKARVEKRQEGSRSRNPGTRKITKIPQEYRTGRDLSFSSVICCCKHTGHMMYLVSSQSSLSSAVSIALSFPNKRLIKPSAFWQQRTNPQPGSLPMASSHLLVLLPTYSWDRQPWCVNTLEEYSLWVVIRCDYIWL